MSLGLVIESLGALLLVMAVSGMAYACIATLALARFMRRPPTTPSALPSITVLKPMRGDEPGLYENLVSFCAQDYAGPIQLILGAQEPTDPALDVARRLQATFPNQDIIVTADPTLHGTNRKIGNLINMSAHARGEIIVISDSDVRMPPHGLAQITATLQAPGVGLIHCLYRGRPTASFWSKLAALDINGRFAASVVVGEAMGANPCLGPTMALRADLLEQIGGVALLADVLADDFELGRAVRDTGHTIACPPMLIDHVFPEANLGEMLTHELRWARTVRLVQPAGYLGSIIVHFTPLALIGAALMGFSGWSLAMLVSLAVFRQAQAAMLVRMMGSDASVLWLLPLRDLMSFWVFVSAFFGDRVEWRGNRLRVGRNGAIATT